MILGFTGTREGMSPTQEKRVREAVRFYSDSVESAHHGDCVGADAQFHNLCIRYNIPVVLHPPVVEDLRAFCETYQEALPPKDYLARDRDIVDTCNVLLAAPKGRIQKGGTWYTVNYAVEKKKGVYVVFPNGKVERYA